MKITVKDAAKVGICSISITHTSKDVSILVINTKMKWPDCNHSSTYSGPDELEEFDVVLSERDSELNTEDQKYTHIKFEPENKKENSVIRRACAQVGHRYGPVYVFYRNMDIKDKNIFLFNRKYPRKFPSGKRSTIIRHSLWSE